jgi:hypothetical protein
VDVISVKLSVSDMPPPQFVGRRHDFRRT